MASIIDGALINAAKGKAYQQAYTVLVSRMPPAEAQAQAQAIAEKAAAQFADDISRGQNANVALDRALQTASAATAGPVGTDPQAAFGATEVQSEDVKNATNAYRSGIERGNTQYEDVLKYRPDPQANATFAPVTAGQVDARSVAAGAVQAGQVTAQQISPADRLKAAMQDRVSVETTDTADLQATAAGQGAGGAVAAARMKQALVASGQQASGLAAQARGSERRGARRGAMLQAGEQNQAASYKIEELNQQDRQVAQAKIADLDAQRKTTQATLDQARAAGDQQAINAAATKMAEIDQETRRINADLAQRADTENANRTLTADTSNVTNALTADTSNADRTLTAGTNNANRALEAEKTNNQQGLDAQKAQEEQRVNNERLRMDAQKAMQDSAQGLLNEAQREEQVRNARQQMDLAEREFAAARDDAQRAAAREKRDFWGKVLSSVLTGAVTVGAAAITKSDVRAKEGIAKVSPADMHALADAVSKSMSTFSYKAGQGPSGEKAGVMAQDLEKTRLGKTTVSEGPDGTKQVNYAQLATMLAAAALKSKKARN